MSAINRCVIRYRPVRWSVVLMFLILPGIFAFALAKLDKWLDEREYSRERLR